MAPEILMRENLSEFAEIVEIKKIDMWALLMTLFLVINPDQTHTFELTVNESKKNSAGKAFLTSAEQQFKDFLSRMEFPLFSPPYEKSNVYIIKLFGK